MIYNHLKRNLKSFAYYSGSRNRVMISRIYEAINDGTYRLVWVKGGGESYLFIMPAVVWTESQSTVEANIEWEVV
jgi:hypothetical protein